LEGVCANAAVAIAPHTANPVMVRTFPRIAILPYTLIGVECAPTADRSSYALQEIAELKRICVSSIDATFSILMDWDRT
jgi:hypothetical protein